MPPKKHASTRARANKASTAATLAVRDVIVPAPELPEREHGWHANTRLMWAGIWASPMSDEWDASDLHNVYVLAAIYDDIWRAETAKERKDAAGEYRLQRVDLGLSPYSRRRLEWTIEVADDARDKGDRRRSNRTPAGPAKDSRPDPRAGLHSVS